MAFATRLAMDVVFGAGATGRVGTVAARLAGRVRCAQVLADPALAALGHVAPLADALGTAGLAVVVTETCRGEPKEADVVAAATALRDSGARVVVGIGGGSALDVAKLAAVLADASCPPLAYAATRRPLPRRRRRVILIPTTAGTGAEATRTSVISDADGRKLWIWGDPLLPDAVILDPAPTVSLPAPMTAASGLDALVHAIEAATSRRATSLSDAHALHAIRLASTALLRALENPEDLAARGDMLVAAFLAGLAIDQAGTGIAHALGHALAGLAPVAHGRAVALALRAALDWNLAGAPAAFGPVAAALGRDAANAVPSAFAALVEASGLSTDLAGDGLGPADRPRLRSLARAPENAPMLQANPRAVDDAGLAEVIARMLPG